MERTEIFRILTSVFHDVLCDDSIILRPDLSAREVDGWDSLTHIRLLLTVEKSFGVKFSASDIGRLKNVGELAELIGAKTGDAPLVSPIPA
jgi:acyl carrier protein